MAAAGYGAVGEFHYVHHQPDGTPYPEPNAMAIALARGGARGGARDHAAAGRLSPRRVGGVRLAARPRDRCASATPRCEAFLERVDGLRRWAAGVDGVSVGVAAHSVRAVPAEWLAEIARYAEEHGLVRHVHASEQRRELAECEAEHGCSPIELLARTGFLGPRTSVIHAIHVSERDVSLLAETESIVVTCPTTEGNLGDGFLPGLRYRDAGVRLAIGTDEQVRIDPVRGAARDGDAGPPRGPHPLRAAGRRRRGPVGADGGQRARQPGPPRSARRRRSSSTSTTPTSPAWPRGT